MNMTLEGEIKRLKEENARLAGKVAVSDYFGPLGDELRQVCRDLDEIARHNHELKVENYRLREALERFVRNCRRCYGTGYELLNDDDPEAGGTVCLTCKPARAALNCERSEQVKP